jgi:hypothetical protein
MLPVVLIDWHQKMEAHFRAKENHIGIMEASFMHA